MIQRFFNPWVQPIHYSVSLYMSRVYFIFETLSWTIRSHKAPWGKRLGDLTQELTIDGLCRIKDQE